MTDLQALIAVLNAALEHVPAQTKAILVSAATEPLKKLEKALNGDDQTT